MTGRLIIFTRFPEPGRVKTRLIPSLGAQGAANLHQRLTAHTLHWAQELSRDEGIELVVRFEGGDEHSMQACFGSTLNFVRQNSGDLGERLTAALANADSPTVVIGTDCPALTADDIRIAILMLRTADVVLGPATDGGYYLLGMNEPQPTLFVDIPWGTERACEVTQRHAAEAGLTVEVLPALSDIDRPEDLNDLASKFLGGDLAGL